MQKNKILLLENINEVASKNLKEQGHHVDRLSYAPATDELIELLKDYDCVGIRSKTKITAEVLESAAHLKSIGCFCIGTNQVDLVAAQKLGITVFNAPHSNTRSVAELVIAEMIALSRNLGDINTKAHAGIWQKSATGANEVRGKTLGIIGYGHIGSQVSILAELIGMKVVFFDTAKKLPLGNAKSLSLNEVLSSSDFVSLHVPALISTKDMIAKTQLKKMKKGSYLINASRGSVVVISDLVAALKEKHIAGCAIDVYPVEPASNKEEFKSELQGIENVILTPHIGGSTEEAQVSIGEEVSTSMMNYLSYGDTSGSVNFPQIKLDMNNGTKRMSNIHRNEPGVLGEINGIISKYGANIVAQALGTSEKIGYAVFDIEGSDIDSLCLEISKLDKSMRTLVLN